MSFNRYFCTSLSLIFNSLDFYFQTFGEVKLSNLTTDMGYIRHLKLTGRLWEEGAVGNNFTSIASRDCGSRSRKH